MLEERDGKKCEGIISVREPPLTHFIFSDARSPPLAILLSLCLSSPPPLLLLLDAFPFFFFAFHTLHGGLF